MLYRQNRSCSCHASCVEAGTCCADFMEAAAEAAEEEEPPPRGPATACEEVRVSAALVTRHVSLVATCPPGHPAPGHVAGCGRMAGAGAGAGRYTHLLDIPVTSLDTGLVYRWPLDTVRLDVVFVSFAPLLSLCHKTYVFKTPLFAGTFSARCVTATRRGWRTRACPWRATTGISPSSAASPPGSCCAQAATYRATSAGTPR